MCRSQAVSRYNAPSTIPLIRRLLEARETQTAAKRNFFRHLLAEFSKERALWLRTVRYVPVRLIAARPMLTTAA